MDIQAERESLLFLAKLAEQTSRGDESVQYITQLVKLGLPLSDDERNLFSVAFKNQLTSPRNAWRLFSSSEAREESLGNSKNARLIREYRTKVEQELQQICSTMISLLDEWLIPKADSQACSVFYWKMKGDYLRYKAEFVEEGQRGQVVADAEAAYEKATELAASLPPTNIVRLGLALNYSVFFYEIKAEPEKACKIARETYQQASNDLKNEHFDNSSYKDITVILQLFQDNLTLWHADE